MAGSTYQIPTYPHWTGCIHTGPDLTNTDTGLLPVLSPSTHQHQQHNPRTTIAAIPVNTSVTSRPSRLATLFSLSVPFHRCFVCHPSNLSLFLSAFAVPGKKAALSTLFCSLVHFQPLSISPTLLYDTCHISSSFRVAVHSRPFTKHLHSTCGTFVIPSHLPPWVDSVPSIP
ncbi:uncharacterized protein LY79DRAFT_244199 [Colletotrichum navitas]|uniref:Uncharacterized protein n=1 Tax=Colletotrichum navitas TaxID=681940 RepID=A0AAD8PWV7_9PEZI|nr:uncharacterized protein LY79DRAFT_244199 [Colletotrichum navitas]KAK1586002.1 hypothetical protein LY79DRAFT_244199 [Colletotrichum navitas]